MFTNLWSSLCGELLGEVPGTIWIEAHGYGEIVCNPLHWDHREQGTEESRSAWPCDGEHLPVGIGAQEVSGLLVSHISDDYGVEIWYLFLECFHCKDRFLHVRLLGVERVIDYYEDYWRGISVGFKVGKLSTLSKILACQFDCLAVHVGQLFNLESAFLGCDLSETWWSHYVDVLSLLRLGSKKDLGCILWEVNAIFKCLLEVPTQHSKLGNDSCSHFLGLLVVSSLGKPEWHEGKNCNLRDEGFSRGNWELSAAVEEYAAFFLSS